jgi:selenocysteine lyase/cysteine desulfurase
MDKKDNTGNSYTELEQGVYSALETYSNVHRGSGQFSTVSTHLLEQARAIVLDYLGLNKGKYVVIFCTPRGAETLKAKLEPGSWQSLSSNDLGLSLGVRALAVERKALPDGPPVLSGGGTARLVSPGWVIWESGPDKFEAGTPAIINIITFARALCLIRKQGDEIFMYPPVENLTAHEILYNDKLDIYSGRELMDELRKNMIGYGVSVPTVEGSKPYISLDNSASTLTSRPVWNSVRQTWHQSGQVQKDIIQEVKSICLGFLGAAGSGYDCIFTSNTTEAINLAAESLSREPEDNTQPVILNTLLEHTSNDLPWRLVPQFSLLRLNADAEGFLDLNEMETILSAYNQKGQHGRKRIRLIALSGASNVLGSFNDLEEISRIIHKYGARLLVDAAQMVAHRKVDMGQCNIDYLAFSGHKVYAPFGTGVLVIKKGLLNFNEAELEQIQRSGEENAGGIAALGKALLIMQRIGMDVIREKEHDLTGRALRGLSKINGLRIYGIDDPDSPKFDRKGGVIVFSLKGIVSSSVARELADRGGIGVRYGCHCAHILIKHLLGVGPGLERFQRILVKLFPTLKLPGLTRVSLGIWNTEKDVDTLIEVLGKIANKAGTIKDKPSDATRDGTNILTKANLKQQINDFVKAASLRVYSQLP